MYISAVVWHYIQSDLLTYHPISFILFQICRDECEVLEYQLCQKELAIARSQPMISHQLVLPDCKELPVIGWVAKIRPYFFQILHISPILEKITRPFRLFQQKITLKKVISTKWLVYDNPPMFLPHFLTDGSNIWNLGLKYIFLHRRLFLSLVIIAFISRSHVHIFKK